MILSFFSSAPFFYFSSPLFLLYTDILLIHVLFVYRHLPSRFTKPRPELSLSTLQRQSTRFVYSNYPLPSRNLEHIFSSTNGFHTRCSCVLLRTGCQDMIMTDFWMPISTTTLNVMIDLCLIPSTRRRQVSGPDIVFVLRSPVKHHTTLWAATRHHPLLALRPLPSLCPIFVQAKNRRKLSENDEISARLMVGPKKIKGHRDELGQYSELPRSDCLG